MKRINYLMLACFVLLFFAGCDSDTDPDMALQQRVAAAIDSASDLPSQGIQVTVESGVVTVSGSIECEDCGGNRTPGGTGTVQQSLGAVVRAVPGVDRVVFNLQ